MTDFETKYRDLVAGVRALADDFDTTVGFRGAATALRALLASSAQADLCADGAGGSSPAEREGEGPAIPEAVWHEWHGDGAGPDAAAVRAPAPVSSGEAGDEDDEFPQCPHEAIRATCPDPCGCSCGRGPCRVRSATPSTEGSEP